MMIIYQPEVGAPTVVNGIFDEQYVLDKGSAEAGVETRIPAVFVRLAALPADPDDDDPILIIGSARYRVTERIPAGLGSIVLGLRKVT